MAKILVVEDEQFFREAICDLLKDYNHIVSEAENGKVAIDIINLQDFDLVISDIQMPKLTGTELLKWSNQNKPIPFILMTGFSMLLETKSAYELGAKEFITKPFKPNELLKLIDKIIVEKPADISESAKTTYCKVSIEEFVARPKTDFDIFVKVSEQKYIKVANRGEVLETNRLMQYRQKGVKYLFISNEDFQKLIEINLNISKLIQNRSDISKEKKLTL